MLAVLVAFLAQQYAVQDSLDLDNGVTYVKTMVMAHIVFTSLLGFVALGERAPPGIGLASALTLMGGIGLLWVQ